MRLSISCSLQMDNEMLGWYKDLLLKFSFYFNVDKQPANLVFCQPLKKKKLTKSNICLQENSTNTPNHLIAALTTKPPVTNYSC